MAEEEDRARLRYLQLKQKATQAQAPEEEEAPTDWRGRAAALGEGAALGWGSEISAGMATAMAKAMGDEKGWGEIYEDISGAERRRQGEYKEAHPGEALALEVGGGLLTGGMGLSKALGTQALKQAPKLTRAATGMGVGAAEGAVAGAGGADPGSRAAGAKTGALIGAAIPGALSAGGGVLRKAAKPMEESTVAGFYRDVVADAFGGGAVRERLVGGVQQAGKKVTNLTKAVARVRESGKQMVKQSGRQIVDDTKAQVAASEKAFRREATNAAIPSAMPREAAEEIMDLPPQQAMEILDTHWMNHGFKDAKQRTYSMNADNFEQGLRNMFKDDPALRQAAGEFTADIMGDFNKAFKRGPDIMQPDPSGIGISKRVKAAEGNISGTDLMELRNKYARAANSTSDALQRTAFRKISGNIDDHITRQLKAADPEALARYQDEMGRWEAVSTLRSATGKASKKKAGDFGQDEWLSATKEYKLRSGKGVLQDAATTGQQQNKALTRTIQQRKDADPIKAQVEQMSKGLKRRLNAAKKAKGVATEAAPSGKPGIFKKLAATGLLGGPAMMGGLPGVAGTIPLGATVAKALSPQGVQRALGGQTAGQAKLLRGQKALEQNPLANILRQGLTRSAAMQSGQ